MSTPEAESEPMVFWDMHKTGETTVNNNEKVNNVQFSDAPVGMMRGNV